MGLRDFEMVLGDFEVVLMGLSDFDVVLGGFGWFWVGLEGESPAVARQLRREARLAILARCRARGQGVPPGEHTGHARADGRRHYRRRHVLPRVR